MSEQPDIQPGTSQWIGKPMRRVEDQRLLTGHGRFTDDISLPGQVHAWFVRSPHAHARIVRIDTAQALGAPGVVAVFTGAEVAAEGLAPLPYTHLHKRPDGTEMAAPPRMALTADVARFVGDAVAMVLAETRDQAHDAAELVEVEWEPLAAAAELAASTRADAAVVWAPAFSREEGNIAAYYRKGDVAAVDAALAAAQHVVRLKVVNQRVVANPLEPRAILAQYDAASGRFTVYCPSQNVHTKRAQLAGVFKLPEDRFHVVSNDMGGGFGTRGYLYPEHAALCFAARRLGRPAKWRADRSEAFLCEVHGRDNITEAALALDAQHRFTALRIHTLANVGAYVSNFGAAVPAMSGARAATGVYAIPALDHEVRIMFTHTAPVDAYRGAGRPEMGYLIERLVARAARELGIDPVELRMKNMVTPAQMPYTTPTGAIYDCGDFPHVLREALELSDWGGFARRKAEAARRGRLYGRGLACYIEVTGSARITETVQIGIDERGAVTLVSGTAAIGQGLATAYAQIVAGELGIDPAAVRVLLGDSDLARTGGGAGGSRGLQIGGSAALGGALRLIETGRALAAKELEAAAVDLEFTNGRFHIAGTDRSLGLAELAARQPARRIVCEHTETVRGQTWPNGCQVCEVEVDPATGVVRVARHSAVDDVGRVINPLMAEGQVHGGVAQGFGQALLEHSVYDESGQLLSGSFMDYAMPRADVMPELRGRFDESVPTALNPLGAKGVGEAGCHGAAPALVNAVLDALAERAVTELDMPLTPGRIWRALSA